MIRVRLNWTGPSSGFSVMHFDGTLSGAQDAADAAALWWDEVNDRFPTTQAMRVDPEVAEISLGTGQTIGTTSVTTAAIAGTTGSTQVPQASMVLMRWRTGAFVNGREIRGRTFIPGLSLGELTAGGELRQQALDDFNAATSILTGATPAFGVYSPRTAGFAEVASGDAWVELAVMRSRRQ